MVASQRRQRDIDRRRRVDPDHRVDLGFRYDVAGHIDLVERGAYAPARLIRRDGIELTERLDGIADQMATQFLGDLARECGDVVLSGAAFSPPVA